MLRVPGNGGSLADRRARGGDVRTMLSPLDALTWAERNPERDVVVLAVGFETTAPATALAVLQAQRRGLTNFSVVAHHVRVLPAMRCVAGATGSRVQAFLAAGHVCTVTGFSEYRDFASRFGLPVVVTGFEPLDLLHGIGACVEALERGEAGVTNRYERCVREEGNVEAMRLIDRVFEVSTIPWRGLGSVPDGGYRLRKEFAHLDARNRLEHESRRAPAVETACRSGEVLTGTLRPPECFLFGTACTPHSPLGAPMVSSEGACAAYFRYGFRTETNHA
jgi:hydrogenase expression/formation protein HypD